MVNKGISDTVMGGVSIVLEQSISYPGTWINKYHKLKNTNGDK